MLLERRTVSRKTAGDGRLEITKPTAERLEAMAAPFSIELDGLHIPTRIGTMACTCRGAENPHVHYFLEAERLKSLAPGGEVELELDEGAQCVHIRPASQDR
jgi:hypothetical protein